MNAASQYPFKDTISIVDILLNDKPVRLAIVAGEINNSLSTNLSPQVLENWKGSIKAEMLAFHENLYLTAYQKDNNLSIVDRNTTEKILKEMEFQQTGLVPENRAKLGNMLGATHLLIVDFSRTGLPFVDTTIRRLIEVESGTTLAVSSCSLRK